MSAKPPAQPLATLATQLEQAKVAASKELASIRARIEQATAETDHLTNAPLSRADLEAIMLGHMKALQDKAIQYSGLEELLDHQRRLPGSFVTMREKFGAYNPFPSRWNDLVMHAFFTPDSMITSLAPVLDLLDYSGAGPTVSERRRELARLDVELAELRQSEQSLASAIGAKE
ncbi:hypothetical protein [uncultured Thiodictyon sp.]|uniref:hypothetical protein n=1 Tax=uncultured Thiodictyon sp. TaxID=1846217 RepID=UPI0025F1E5A7|nr:hypothetical protein [uncultured Thiodictyon sp.]